METKRNFGVRLHVLNVEDPPPPRSERPLPPERLAEVLQILSPLLWRIEDAARWQAREAKLKGGLDFLVPSGVRDDPPEPWPPRWLPRGFEPAAPPPTIPDVEQGRPAGLEQWYRDEHIPRGRSSRDQDLAAARERFGAWTGDRADMARLRKKYAPDDWRRRGRPVKNKLG